MENKNLFGFLPLIACAVVAVIAITASLYLLSEKNNLAAQAANSKIMLKKMQEEVDDMKAKTEETLKEKEKLQADAISYIGVNTNLQREKEGADKKLKAALEIASSKDIELQEAEKKLGEMEKKLARQKRTETGKAEETQQERQELLAKLSSLEETIRNERGLYHYNLAVAYTQAKLYDEAVDSYNESLKYNPDNAEAFYNLGLLYENFKGDPDFAIRCYSKYLELKPDALDKEEVQGWIDRLK